MTDKDELLRRYGDGLNEYLNRGDEVCLQRAYEIGRHALSEKVGVLEMVAIHHQVMLTTLESSDGRRDLAGALRRGGEFLIESMSPYEMTHRAYGEANAALRRLNETLEEEAKRIAHALHDESTQLLAAVHLAVDEMGRQFPRRSRERLQKVKQLLDEVEGQLRRLSHELRPTILDDLGLLPALKFLAEGFSLRTGLVVTVEGAEGQRFAPNIETAIYRIVQEGLNNAARYAKATRVKIQIASDEQFVHCAIADDGVGFDPSLPPFRPGGHGLGLPLVRERVGALGGKVVIDSIPAQGSTLTASIPWRSYDDTSPSGG